MERELLSRCIASLSAPVSFDGRSQEAPAELVCLTVCGPQSQVAGQCYTTSPREVNHSSKSISQERLAFFRNGKQERLDPWKIPLSGEPGTVDDPDDGSDTSSTQAREEPPTPPVHVNLNQCLPLFLHSDQCR